MYYEFYFIKNYLYSFHNYTFPLYEVQENAEQTKHQTLKNWKLKPFNK